MHARILCVEDEDDFLDSLAEFLQDCGYHVSTADNGHRALELIENEAAFDLILSDVCMPLMGGYDFLQTLRANYPDYLATPFIFLTAQDQKDDVLRAHKLGCDEYLGKPVDLDFLHTMVESRLQRVSVIREHGVSKSASPVQQELLKALASELLEPTNGIISISGFLASSVARFSDDDLNRRFAELYQFAGHQLVLLQQVLNLMSVDKDEAIMIADYACELDELIAQVKRSVLLKHRVDECLFECDARVQLLCDPFIASKAMGNLLHQALQRRITPQEKPFLRLVLQEGQGRVSCVVADSQSFWQSCGDAHCVPISQQRQLLSYATILSGRFIPALYIHYVAQSHGGELAFYYDDAGNVAFELVFPTRRTVRLQLAV